MRTIAKKVGFSETAFVRQSDIADFRVRFFTPSAEVDLCGHATIATFALLLNKGLISPGKYSQETKAGVLNIEVSKHGEIFMDQNLPQFFDTIKTSLIAESLNIDPTSISSDSPIQIISTGLRDIFVPIKTIDQLTRIKPDFEKIKEISKQFDVIGYHIFTLETRS